MALSCFDHAFAKAENDEVADVWYNIGHVAVGKLVSPAWCYMQLLGTE